MHLQTSSVLHFYLFKNSCFVITACVVAVNCDKWVGGHCTGIYQLYLDKRPTVNSSAILYNAGFMVSIHGAQAAHTIHFNCGSLKALTMMIPA